MKFTSKQALLESIETEHRVFVELLESIPRSRYREAGVWGDGWNVQDLLAHLTEWERFFLRWFRDGRAGRTPALPAPGYKWNQTPELNKAIWRKHRARPLSKILGEFGSVHASIVSVAKDLTPSELLRPGAFNWTGKHPLTSYLAPNTCSHYRTATRILKRWLKSQASTSRRIPSPSNRC